MRILDWKSLSPPEQAAALQRPAQRDAEAATAAARHIIDAVRLHGDAALKDFTERYDGVRLTDLAVSNREFDAADRALSTPTPWVRASNISLPVSRSSYSSMRLGKMSMNFFTRSRQPRGGARASPPMRK